MNLAPAIIPTRIEYGASTSLSSNFTNPSPQSAAVAASRSWRTRLIPTSLLARFVLLGLCVALDVAILAYLPRNFSLLGPFAPIGIVAFAAFIGLGYSYLRTQEEPLPFSTSLFCVHLACVAAVSSASLDVPHSLQTGTDALLQLTALRTVLVAGLVMLGLACIPLPVWIRTIRSSRWLGAQAILAGLVAWCLRFPAQSLWRPESSTPGRLLQALTFRTVSPLLHAVLPGVTVDPSQFTIGTDRFAITIAEQCSGLEGLGLVLIFVTLWLWYFRKEMRFPRALLLIPCALISVWILNILRIAALVVIGNAGAPDVAMEGFHSQAGWIAFTLVALLFSISARRIRWARIALPDSSQQSPSPATFTGSTNVTSEKGESPAVDAYLVPFLAILAASFLSRAASGSFEWLYPLRFVAAVLALWLYRGELKRIHWRFSWVSPLAGAILFALGLAASHILQPGTSSTLGSALAALSPQARITWLAFRIAAAVITIPIAEELAFRGYLARRLIRFSDPEFEQQSLGAITPLSILLSSVAYGLMYGRFWALGLAAGLTYAGLAKWKSRLGDAVIAHATSGLLLAVWILATGNWSLW